MKRSRTLIVSILGAAALLAAACGRGGDGGETGADVDTVTILSLWGGSEREAFQQVLDGFTEATGIQTQYETANDFLPVIRTRLAAGNPPMVAIIPRPGVVADFARDGHLVPLADLGLTDDLMSERYSAAWTDLGTVDGQLYGIAVKANSKSTVWYKPNSFEQHGFDIPQTWDDLLELTEQHKAAGLTPWAVGANPDHWVLTDWFENIYARTAGIENYDALHGGELQFTDETVVEALEHMVEIINEENVAGGIDGALGTSFVDGIGLVFGTNPQAEMYYQGGFVGGIALTSVNPDLVPGEDIAFFPFPTINPEHGDPLIGAGDLAVAFEDNAAVRELMYYLTTKEAGEIWAATGAIVSPNATVDPAVYPNVLAQAEAEQVAAAEVFRFDGSDLFPGALAEDWGTMLQSVIREADQIQRLLEDFDVLAAQEFGRD